MREVFEAINWTVVAPFIIIQGILLIVAVIDWAKADRFNGPKWMWFFIIIFVNILGPILYFIFGRSKQ